MGVPKEIREVPRPVNTVVTDNVRNTPLRYSVRERASSGKYVPGKNPKPKNGSVIGHIIGFKYVPLDAAETGNASGSREKPETPEESPAKGRQAGPVPEEEAPVSDSFLMYGIPAFAKSVSDDILEDLLAVYDINDAVSILVMAILRIMVPGISGAEYAEYYRSTFLRVFYPGARLSESRIGSLESWLGASYGARLKLASKRLSRVSEGHRIAAGRILVSDRSAVSGISEYSCISRSRDAEDVWAIYAYDSETMEPLCTEIQPDSAPNAGDLDTFLLQNNIGSGILIAEDGFLPEQIAGTENGSSALHFIMPVEMTDSIMEKYGTDDWTDHFEYGGDIFVACSANTEDGRFMYVFNGISKSLSDEGLWHEEQRRKHNLHFGAAAYEKAKKRFGTSLFESDLELPPETVYRSFKSRWLPELLLRQCMSDFTKIHTSSWSDHRLSGLGLICSVSALITIRMMTAARSAHLLDRMTFGELMVRLSSVRRMADSSFSGKMPDALDGRWSVPLKSSMELLARLGLVSGIEVPQPKRRGRPPRKKQEGTA